MCKQVIKEIIIRSEVVEQTDDWFTKIFLPNQILLQKKYSSFNSDSQVDFPNTVDQKERKLIICTCEVQSQDWYVSVKAMSGELEIFCPIQP